MSDFADELAWLLATTAGELARTVDEQVSTSAPPEQVDLVFGFRRLCRYLDAFLPRVVTGEVEGDEWRMLSSALAALSQECRRQLDCGPAAIPAPGASGGEVTVVNARLAAQGRVLEAFRQVTGWPDEVVIHYSGNRGVCGCLPVCGHREYDCPEAEAAWRRSRA